MTEARALVPAERRNITAVAPILNGAADSDRPSNLGRRAPPIAIAADPAVSTDPVVVRGRAALKRRNAAERERLLDERRIWPDYVEVGHALMVGRAWAKAKAHTDKLSSKKYQREFGHWLQANQLHAKYLHKDHRSKLLVLMENLPEVEAWRASLKVRANHPYNVWAAWTCPNRGGRWRDQQAEAAAAPAPEAASDPTASDSTASDSTASDPTASDPTASDPTASDSTASDSKAEERKTLGRLLVDVNKLIGVVKDLREFSGEIDDVVLDTLVRMTEELATEVPQTAALLKERQRQRQQRAA